MAITKLKQSFDGISYEELRGGALPELPWERALARCLRSF
jgi:hypothetical protein